MSQQALTIYPVEHEISVPSELSPITIATVLPESTSQQLTRMFRDPYILEKDERVELIKQLREAVALEPTIPELRVVLGMALCTNFEAQSALEELRVAASMAPDNFLSRLKFGELLMRLRICRQAAEETHAAAKLASNPIQSELARKQAAVLRTMMREGIERGSKGKVVAGFDWLFSLFSRDKESSTSAALNSR